MYKIFSRVLNPFGLVLTRRKRKLFDSTIIKRSNARKKQLTDYASHKLKNNTDFESTSKIDDHNLDQYKKAM